MDVLIELDELIGQAEESMDYCSETGPNESMKLAIALKEIRNHVAALIDQNEKLRRAE